MLAHVSTQKLCQGIVTKLTVAQVSLMEELGNVEESELNSSAEARKLAFYLFWCAAL